VAVIANDEEARKQLDADATALMSREDLVRLVTATVTQSVLPIIDVLGRLTEKELGDLAGEESDS
jgi:hypothetical protein